MGKINWFANIEYAEDALIDEIEIELGWGCAAEDVAEVLTLMQGKSRTDKNLRLALRSYRARQKEEGEAVGWCVGG